LGEALFKKHCAVCHPDGSNIANPQKTLHAKDRAANKIVTADDIVKLMRNPGPGMVKFGEQVISEKDAKAIAEYILKTFNK
jgi:cytochrome c6